MDSQQIEARRRRILQTAGVSTAGIIGFSGRTLAEEVHATEAVDGAETGVNSYGTEPGVQKIEADPDAGFHSPYFLYTPSFRSVEESLNDSKVRPLVVTTYPWGDFEERVAGAQDPDRGITGRIADAMNCPVLSVPLTLTRGHLGLEPQELTLAPELEITDPRRERVDLQFIAMIEDAKSRLNAGSYTIADGIHYDGASSAGDFIERIAPLHPEHINAYSSGANGYAFLPFTGLTDDLPVHGDPDRTTVPWPIGAGNLEELTGEAFNEEAWMDIEQFRWIGGKDQDPEDPDNYVRKRFKGDDEMDQVVEEFFGTLQVDDRFETSRKIYDHLDVPATFRTFEGQPHSPAWEYRSEAAEFHKERIEDEFELLHVTLTESDSEAYVGDTVTARVTVENATGVESSTTVSFAVDGPEGETTEIETTEVQVDSKSAETVELETVFEETGEFTLRINGTAIEDSVVVTEEPTEEVNGTGTETSEGDAVTDQGGVAADEAPGFGVVQTLMAVGGIGYLIDRYLSTDD